MLKVSSRTITPQLYRLLGSTRAASTKVDLNQMFCFQCEQTENATGCTKIGVCGKDPETAKLQDLLVHAIKGIAQYEHATRQVQPEKGISEQDRFVLRGLFSTLTNVNFDADRIQEYIEEAAGHIQKAKAAYEEACEERGVQADSMSGPASDKFAVGNRMSLLEQAESEGVLERKEKLGDTNVHSLIELTVYGLKGAAAYAEHAHILGKEDEQVYAGMQEILSTLTRTDLTVDEMLGVALKVGEINTKVLAMLDAGHNERFGIPQPTSVNRVPKVGKCILVSGHDMQDLHDILEQTQGKNIDVYTHGELLNAHSYPELAKFEHLQGHYGGAWQQQKFDFRSFPGPIVMTTNCLIEPGKRYKNRIFTRSVVGWPGVKHIEGRSGDFSQVIEAALAEPGFEPFDVEEMSALKPVSTGFGHKAVLGVVDKVMEGIQSGQLKHFFVVGGCDGSEGERSYYTEVAKNSPEDSMILTLGCGKYRVNQLELGTVAGLPRVLDMGQCNDAYSAVVVATKLSEALNVPLNQLPLSFAVSWFEQKAVAVLLTLLNLGVKNIRLGPNLPAFVTPDVLGVLVDKFQIKPIGSAPEDVKAMLQGL